MVLYCRDVKTYSSLQDENITDDEMKIIEKKSGDKGMKISFLFISVFALISAAYMVVCEKEFPLFYLLVFLFFLPVSIDACKHKETCACYGTVVDKTVRCAKLSARRVYLPYAKTEEIGTFKHKFTLSATVYEFFYCTVEINGQIYENVCCLRKDHPIIDIGDRVIIANDDIYHCPVIYKVSRKQDK